MPSSSSVFPETPCSERKIKDFVLVGDEEDVPEDEEDIGNEPAVIDDFEHFSDATKQSTQRRDCRSPLSER